MYKNNLKEIIISHKNANAKLLSDKFNCVSFSIHASIGEIYNYTSEILK